MLDSHLPVAILRIQQPVDDILVRFAPDLLGTKPVTRLGTDFDSSSGGHTGMRWSNRLKWVMLLHHDVMPETGFLTEKQREFLAGARPEMSENNKRVTRTRIKQRTIAAIRDFPFLLNLPDEKIREFVEELDRETLSEELQIIDETVGIETHGQNTVGELIPILEFCYIALNRDTGAMERMIQSAIAWSDLDPSQQDSFVVNVEIETEPTTGAIKEKFERGKELTDRELALLVRHGDSIDLDYEELQQEMAERH